MELESEIINDINISFTLAKSIFENLDYEKFKKLKFTQDSLYSSSKVKGSKRLVDIILKSTNNNYNITITDGTANIGTDTIFLAKYFDKINSIEISDDSFIALENNVKLLGERNNINCIKGDSNLEIKKLYQDIIYIDAPWGGTNYKNYENLKLYLGEVEILDFYKNNKELSNIFVFKVPYNYDFEYLKQYIDDKIVIYPYKKDNRVKFFYIVIEKNT